MDVSILSPFPYPQHKDSYYGLSFHPPASVFLPDTFEPADQLPVFPSPVFFINILRIMHLLSICRWCEMINFLKRLIERRCCRKSIIHCYSCNLFVTVNQFIHRMKQSDIIYIFQKTKSKMFFYILR